LSRAQDIRLLLSSFLILRLNNDPELLKARDEMKSRLDELIDLCYTQLGVNGPEKKTFEEVLNHAADSIESFQNFELRHIEIQKREGILYHCKGTMKKFKIEAVKLDASSLNSGDVYILDKWDVIFSFYGKDSEPIEQLEAQKYINQHLTRDRNVKIIRHIIHEGEEDDTEFWSNIPPDYKRQSIAAGDRASDSMVEMRHTLFRLSDETGSITFEKVELPTGTLTRSDLDDNDVFIIDAEHTIYVWVGIGTSKTEKVIALEYAEKYLVDEKQNTNMTISLLHQSGITNDQYKLLFGASFFK